MYPRTREHETHNTRPIISQIIIITTTIIIGIQMSRSMSPS